MRSNAMLEVVKFRVLRFINENQCIKLGVTECM